MRRGWCFSAGLRLPLAIAALLCAGCTWQSPRTIAQNYVTALKQHNYAQCYAMLTEDDRRACPLDRFLTEVPLAPDATRRWFSHVLKATEFEINEPQGQGLRRTVPVNVKGPDLARLERIVNAAAGPDADPAPAASDALAHRQFPELAYREDIVLVKEHHRWRVRADFPAREQAADLRRQALDRYYAGFYDQALDFYRQAIAVLERSHATGGLGLKFLYSRELRELEAIMNERAAAAAYADNLKLADVGMRMSAGGRPAVFGRITNGGNRAVDSVRLKVTFFERTGTVRRSIFVEQHVPIATPLQFSDFATKAIPLMPGETRDFGFELKAPIATQQAADPYVTVGDVILTQADLMPPAGGEPRPTQKSASPAATATAGGIEE
jgi:hypothetical protein